VQQPTGYRAFIPDDLPPDPPIDLGGETAALLARASMAVGRLDGVTQIVPNVDVFIAMYVRREAVDSSKIEGTQSSLQDVLAFELDPATRDLPRDVEDVVNYVRAMNYGLDRLTSFPLSLRLIREIHAELMQGVRGSDKSPGEFRRTQNWIGAGNVPLGQATFVPPPVHEMELALDDLEAFLHHDHGLPVLVHCALAHVQFETIHPFLDGNGRVGRLLIASQLVHKGVLQRPLLYLSTWLRHHREDYYERLMAVRRDGDWDGWLRFFLRGVAETAEGAVGTARSVVRLREVHHALLRDQGIGTNGGRLLDLLFQRPLVNVALVTDQLNVTHATAGKLIAQLVRVGLLEEITGQKRNRIFRYTPYWRLFQDADDSEPMADAEDRTGAPTS
jgi:Fic family protein